MAMPSKCFCFDFWFCTACGTSISCSLGRQYWPVFSLSFLNVFAFYFPFVFLSIGNFFQNKQTNLTLLRAGKIICSTFYHKKLIIFFELWLLEGRKWLTASMYSFMYDHNIHGCRNIHHNDTHYSNTQRNDSEHIETQRNGIHQNNVAKEQSA